MKKGKLILFLSGLAACLTSFGCLFSLSVPTMGEQTVSFASKYNKKDVTLEGSYWEVKDSEYAVLICPGYSCDRQKWRPMADVLVSNGFSAMSFDYSGQGGSSSTIGFSNAKVDYIPVEIDDAIEKLHEVSGIDYDHIILLGHSMGGRSILRLLYDYHNPIAETTVTPKDIRNVVLFSPEVNYAYNAQASLFAGTSDAEEDPWKDYSSLDVQGTNVYVYGSTADDTVTDKDVLALYKHMGGDASAPDSGTYRGSSVNDRGSKLTVGVTGGVLHSYQMYDFQFAGFLNEALGDISGRAMTFQPGSIVRVYLGWAFGLGGVFLVLLALNKKEEALEGVVMNDAPPKPLPLEELPARETLPILKDPKNFLLRKLLMWLPGIGMAFLVCCLCIVMPFGSPIMNIPYMCFISGYGLVMLIAYGKGRFKGTEGKLPRPSFKSKEGWRTILIGCLVTFLVCLFVWYALRTSMYRLLPANWRLFWLAVCGGLMIPGYYVSSVENDMLKEAKCSKLSLFLYNVIQYVPLFLFVLFYAAIGSFSGFIGQMQNMILMYLFCLPMGNYLRKKTGNRLYGAILTAVLFQGVMITSAALISFF